MLTEMQSLLLAASFHVSLINFSFQQNLASSSTAEPWHSTLKILPGDAALCF